VVYVDIKNTQLKDFSIRKLICPFCTTHCDRDENDSNILINEDLRIVGIEFPEFIHMVNTSMD
jgi:predicted metal-dependent HD superfamily phosphohydrolase